MLLLTLFLILTGCNSLQDDLCFFTTGSPEEIPPQLTIDRTMPNLAGDWYLTVESLLPNCTTWDDYTWISIQSQLLPIDTRLDEILLLSSDEEEVIGSWQVGAPLIFQFQLGRLTTAFEGDLAWLYLFVETYEGDLIRGKAQVFESPVGYSTSDVLSDFTPTYQGLFTFKRVN